MPLFSNKPQFKHPATVLAEYVASVINVDAKYIRNVQYIEQKRIYEFDIWVCNETANKELPYIGEFRNEYGDYWSEYETLE